MKHTLIYMLTMAACVANVAQTEDVEELVTFTLLQECRGETAEGIRAVGQVILNRARAKDANNITASIKAVILKPKQFSCWNNKEAITGRIRALKGECEAKTNLCESIAAFICQNMNVFEDFPHNHYFAHNKCNPSWAYGSHVKSRVRIDNHTFLEL